MMQRNFPKRKFALLLVIAVSILFVKYCLMFKPAYAAEKYTRKSISLINEVLLLSKGKRIPKDKIPDVLKGVSEQIEMSRFDYNSLPESWHVQFWRKLQRSQEIQEIESMENQIHQNELEVDKLERRAEELNNRLIELKSRGTSRTERENYSRYSAELKDCRTQQKRLKEGNSIRLEQLKTKRAALFDGAASILTEQVPTLMRVLSDPEVQRERAKELVDEVERQKFIVKKAKSLGITSEDLEKVMYSAYLYMIYLTDYKARKTKGDKIVCEISGGIAWFKIDESAGKPQIKLLQVIKADGAGSKLPGVSPLEMAIKSFAQNLKLETRKIDDFSLGEGIVTKSGSKVSFPLGKKEGIRIDQKFLVYEKYKRGDEIKERKKGFFYVSKIGDNISKRDALSYGKVVIGRAEPGMQVREYPTTGLDFILRFKSGNVKLNPGKLDASPYRLNVSNEVDTPIYTLNGTFHYDLGRYLRLPQLFFTFGGDIGFVSFGDLDVDVEPHRSWNSNFLYYTGYAGLLQKYYIRRIAFYVEPIVKIENLWLSWGTQLHNFLLNWGSSTDKVSFTHREFSFSPNVGIELAIRENINLGFALGVRLSRLVDGKWSVEGSELSLSDETSTIPSVTYPNLLMGVYLSYSIPKLWKSLLMLM